MKNYKIITIALAFMLVVFGLPMSVAAQTDEEQSNLEQETTSEQADTKEKDSQKEQKREERINEAREKQQDKIDAAKSQRLKTRCKSAQGKITSAQSKINGVVTSRAEKYQALSTRLAALAATLDDAGVNTAELKLALSELDSSIQKFNSEYDSLKITVTDLAEMDCEADPEGFQAVLEQARSELKDLKDSSKTTHSQLKDVIKPILQNIKSQLDSTQARDEDIN